MDSRSGIRKGGESGAAILPGRPDESLLVQSIAYEDLEMPPDQKLSPAIVNDFKKWIREGAPDPRTGKKKSLGKEAKSKYEPESLWSFKPPARPEVPKTKNGDWGFKGPKRFRLVL